MRQHPIDIIKSKHVNRMVYVSRIDKALDYMLPLSFAIAILFAGGLKFYFDFKNNNSIELSLIFLIASISIASLLMYWTRNIHTLIRIKGLSRVKNSKIVKRIAKENNWNVSSSNKDLTIIYFDWNMGSTDWGKEMTILYDKNDILVNCISYGLNSNPSPFHWAANERKVNTLKTEFENGIKNDLQRRL